MDEVSGQEAFIWALKDVDLEVQHGDVIGHLLDLVGRPVLVELAVDGDDFGMDV